MYALAFFLFFKYRHYDVYSCEVEDYNLPKSDVAIEEWDAEFCMRDSRF